jgi:hypothetical protein
MASGLPGNAALSWIHGRCNNPISSSDPVSITSGAANEIRDASSGDGAEGHCNVYVRSRRAGERVMASITRFIMTKLKLKVNQQKSAVARPWDRKFPGFSFTANWEPKRRIAPKAVLRFKEKVRELTRRTRGVSTERMAEDLSRYLRGWTGYFGKCQTP